LWSDFQFLFLTEIHYHFFTMELDLDRPVTSAERILTVTEITRRIKGVLETGFSGVAVQGEISNFRWGPSGHMYFTLKDEHAQLNAIMWRLKAMNLFFTPQDGMKVIARGNITVYEVRGVYQIDVLQLQPLGVGELQLAFEQLKRKLAAEGLFDSEHKKPLPPFPERVGIITSPTSAAIRDMLNILARRFPALEVVLYPVRVQGAGAAEEIAEALRDFNEYGEVDVLIVGRGGGSLEDLWAFNEEAVARAIYASEVPVVSAVGHEIDFTIADFVADLRAPTPSAAAELVVKNRDELVEIVRNFQYTATDNIRRRIESEKETIRNLLGSYAFNKPFDLIRQFSQRVDEHNRTLMRMLGHRLVMDGKHVASLQQRLHVLNPDHVLKRGYVIVQKDDEYIGSSKNLHAGDSVKMKFHDGHVPATVD
jgi:exodeoxyribonuclease VII large subunit